MKFIKFSLPVEKSFEFPLSARHILGTSQSYDAGSFIKRGVGRRVSIGTAISEHLTLKRLFISLSLVSMPVTL